MMPILASHPGKFVKIKISHHAGVNVANVIRRERYLMQQREPYRALQEQGL